MVVISSLTGALEAFEYPGWLRDRDLLALTLTGCTPLFAGWGRTTDMLPEGLPLGKGKRPAEGFGPRSGVPLLHADPEGYAVIAGGGLVVLDVDAQDPPAAINDLARKTLTVATPHGGWHIYVRVDDVDRLREATGNPARANADWGHIAWDGQYVIGPGSWFFDGYCEDCPGEVDPFSPGNMEPLHTYRFATLVPPAEVEAEDLLKLPGVKARAESDDRGSAPNVDANHRVTVNGDGSAVAPGRALHLAGGIWGADFWQLWRGEWGAVARRRRWNGPDGASQSEADAALCAMLWFATGDRDAVRRLFLASGLADRPKAKREDYIKSTLDLTCRGDTYTPEPTATEQAARVIEKLEQAGILRRDPEAIARKSSLHRAVAKAAEVLGLEDPTPNATTRALGLPVRERRAPFRHRTRGYVIEGMALDPHRLARWLARHRLGVAERVFNLSTPNVFYTRSGDGLHLGSNPQMVDGRDRPPPGGGQLMLMSYGPATMERRAQRWH